MDAQISLGCCSLVKPSQLSSGWTLNVQHTSKLLTGAHTIGTKTVTATRQLHGDPQEGDGDARRGWVLEFNSFVFVECATVS